MAEGGSRPATLTLIALFRLGKAVVLLAAVAGVLRMLDPSFARHVQNWLTTLPFLDRHPEVDGAVHKLVAASPLKMEIAAAVGLGYALLFSVEGVGLWLGKAWAEYLTIVATTSFVPLEIYELARQFTPLRLGALVVNVAIVAYLVVRRLRARRSHRGIGARVRSRLAPASR